MIRRGQTLILNNGWWFTQWLTLWLIEQPPAKKYNWRRWLLWTEHKVQVETNKENLKLTFLNPIFGHPILTFFLLTHSRLKPWVFFGKDINFSAVCVRWSERWPLSFPMIASQHCLSYLLTKIGFFLKQFLLYFLRILWWDTNDQNWCQREYWSGTKNIFKIVCSIRRELKEFLFANLSHKSLWLLFMTAVVSMWHT